MNVFAREFGMTLIAAGVAAGAVAGCQSRSDDKSATSQPATAPAEKDEGPSVKLDPAAVKKFGIVTKKVYAHALEQTFTAPARVAFNSEAMASVGAPVPGRVQAIKAKLGDLAKKGDELLVVISNDLGEAQSDYLLKQTSAEAATEAVKPAKAAFDRAQSLYDKSEGIALTEVEKRKADWKTAEAAQKTGSEALSAATRKLHLLGMTEAAIENIGKSRNVEPVYVVRAPIDGRVIDRNATLGQQVAPDKEPLFTLADTTVFWVIADVPESRLKDIAMDGVVRVTAAGLREQVVTGVIAYVAPAIDPATRTVQVRITVPGNTTGLKPGMFAEAEFDLPSAPDAEAVITVPEAAVQTIDGRPAVFMPDDEDPNTFLKRNVIVGPPIKGKIPLLFGVNPREKVVVSGASILKAQLGKPAAD